MTSDLKLSRPIYGPRPRTVVPPMFLHGQIVVQIHSMGYGVSKPRSLSMDCGITSICKSWRGLDLAEFS